MWVKSRKPSSTVGLSTAPPVVIPVPRELLRVLEGSHIRAAAEDLLALFEERIRRVSSARFGLSDGHPRTLQTVGDSEQLTRERIRQLEAFVLRSLQYPTVSIPERARKVRVAIEELLDLFGRAVREETLFSSLRLTEPRDQAALRFHLAATPGITEARETQRTARHWTATAPAEVPGTKAVPPTIEQVLETAEVVLAESGVPLVEDRLLTALRGRLGTATATRPLLLSHLTIARRLSRNPFGEWGLRTWSSITPRGAGDKAYLVLRQRGKPLHFTAIADAVNALFPVRRTHPQTVHNELIRDPRFILVGRGMYALKEWGYEPGTVTEITAKILAQAGRPLTRAELITAVLRQRQVKRNTVLLALCNRQLFRVLGDGRVSLAAAEQAPANAPGSLASAADPNH